MVGPEIRIFNKIKKFFKPAFDFCFHPQTKQTKTRARELAISAEKNNLVHKHSLSQLCKKLDMVADFKFHHKGGRDR